MKIDLCDECKEKVGRDTVSALTLNEQGERVILFALNFTHDVITNMNIKIENYEFTEIEDVLNTLDHVFIRPLNNQRMKRGENSLL